MLVVDTIKIKDTGNHISMCSVVPTCIINYMEEENLQILNTSLSERNYGVESSSVKSLKCFTILQATIMPTFIIRPW